MSRVVRQAQVVRCQLKEWDPAGEDALWIRQARQGEQLSRAELWADVAVETMADGRQRQIYKTPGEWRRAMECWLTFVDSNLSYEEELPRSSPNDPPSFRTLPMFKAGMSEAEFHTMFKRVPQDLVDEWHRAVLDVNPHWDPDRTEELRKNS